MKSEKKKVAKQIQLADQVARKADFNPELQKKVEWRDFIVNCLH
jgi:hypothetical protein